MNKWAFKLLNDGADKCELESKRLAERANKKRARDETPSSEAPATKRPKPSDAPPVLNCTQDRDAAITNMFEALKDVSHTNNAFHNYHIDHTPIDPKETTTSPPHKQVKVQP